MSDILDLLEKAYFKIRANNIKLADIGTTDSSGNITTDTPGRPKGYTQVRIVDGQENSTIATALNQGAPTAYNTRVRLERDPLYNDSWIITQVDPKFIQANASTPIPSGVPPHRHYIGSGLDDPVELRRLIPCRVWSSSGLTINVDPFPYQWNGVNYFFSGITNLDVSSHVPGSGLQRFVVIGIDPTTNTATIIDGSTYSAASLPLYANLLAISTGNIITSGGLALTNGQTVILESNIYDMRPFLSAVGSGVVTSFAVTAPIVNTGTSTAPNIGLTTPLTVNYGGTGVATLTAHALVVGNGTSAVNALAPGTARNVAISDGADWTSRALVDADLPVTLAGHTLTNTNTVTLKDTLFTLQDDGDTTKQLQFQLSGISTSTTRTLTVPDISDTLVTLTATQTLTNKTVTSPVLNTGVSGTAISTDGTFTSPSDTILSSQKAIKTYVDTVAAGLSPKDSVRAATTAALPSNIYVNGVAGVGATLTGVATGVLTVDGYTVALNDRVLVKDESNQTHDGLFFCSIPGAIGVAYVLTRTLDADTSDELTGAYVLVENTSTTLGSTGWVNTNSSIVFGTTNITFSQFSGTGDIIFNAPLSKSGNTVSLATPVALNYGGTASDLSATSGVLFQASSGAVVTTLATTGSGNVVRATSPTLTTPTIADFTNATHNHQNNAGGGQLNAGSIFSAGTVPLARGGTNVDLSAAGAGFLKQATSGANVTVAAVDVSSADITGVLKASAFPALTGDITTGAGALATTLKSTGTAGTYTKVTFDAQGRETSGTTLASGDIPNLPASKITSGQISQARGGTGADTSVGGSAFWYQVAQTFQAGSLAAFDNLLMNGGFWFAQRQDPTTFTTIATDTYGPDRWRSSSEGASLQYIRNDATSESGLTSKWYGQYKQITNTKKFMVYQILEGIDSAQLRSQTVAFHIWMKASSSKTIRMAVIELQNAGTIDTIPGTFITAYGAATTDPTLGSNLAYIGTPTSQSVTTSWSEFGITATVPSNSKNLIFAVWSDTAFSANDTLSVAQAGAFLAPFDQGLWYNNSISIELARCQHYYCKTFDIDQNPIQNAGLNTPGALYTVSSSTSGNGVVTWRYPVPMFKLPTVTTYNPHAANANFRNTADTSTTTVNQIANGTLVGARHSISLFYQAALGDNFYHINASAEAEL